MAERGSGIERFYLVAGLSFLAGVNLWLGLFESIGFVNAFNVAGALFIALLVLTFPEE